MYALTGTERGLLYLEIPHSIKGLKRDRLEAEACWVSSWFASCEDALVSSLVDGWIKNSTSRYCCKRWSWSMVSLEGSLLSPFFYILNLPSFAKTVNFLPPDSSQIKYDKLQAISPPHTYPESMSRPCITYFKGFYLVWLFRMGTGRSTRRNFV